MAAYSLSQAKNYIGRTLRKAVEPEPTEKEIADLWNYFQSSCAYCGVTLKRAERQDIWTTWRIEATTFPIEFCLAASATVTRSAIRIGKSFYALSVAMMRQ